MSTDNGRSLFEEEHKKRRGKPLHARGESSNHEPTKPSKWATAEPVAPRDNTPLLKAGVPGVPSEEALPLRAPAGRSIFSPEQYRERHVPAGESLYAPKYAKPKQEKRGDKVHDRHEPLHGRVRSGRHPAAALKSEYGRASAPSNSKEEA